ncbi:MAG: bifunctional DNA-formamidopyrimidine glycosylase/DNA-(apurinic or apyrimidinic site) lyase [Patescibacteria group bacterium]|nr:bifunctional DNA-formamidopyrimidine glycosylase/DNA-(apurinic or apyrimidinic site) lyase [Patescibacteria group bacterium]MDE1945708.1 bifunctional DNA-formamidopyrimidine glycosylase/DNA-(apurinic or apyrimidinic site) lyase [Patescibacteria group bacterium]
MPELPEVQTTVSILQKTVTGRTIRDVWTDYGSAFHTGKQNIKDKNYFSYFKKETIGKRILGARRRAKNVLIDVSGNKTILVHMKMTGHLLYGKYIFKGGKWIPPHGTALDDPFNGFIHLAFSLSGGTTLVLSDMRKFAKVAVLDTKTLDAADDIAKLGPEPLEKHFTYAVFKKCLARKPHGKVKTVLMDQEIISGIGNIYSDEILWRSGIHPLSRTGKIPERKLRELYKNIGVILRESLAVGGDSQSDYRNPLGKKGGYQNIHKAYRQTGKPCPKRDGGIIKRILVGGRSAHFCPKHQEVYN